MTEVKKYTMKDVAKDADVSPMTVSRVLSNDLMVSEETRKRVLESVERLHYRRQRTSKAPTPSKRLNIGFLYDDSRSGYFNDLTFDILKASGDLDINIVLIEFIEGNLKYVLSKTALDGILVPAPFCEFDSLKETIQAFNLPRIDIASTFSIEQSHTIKVDNYRAAFDMTNYLISKGHTKIGFIKGHPCQGATPERLKGYQKALENHGITVDKSLVEQGFFDFKTGMEAAEKLLIGRPDITAIFASNDDMAAGAVGAANKLGLKIPEQLSIAGFDNNLISTNTWPNLTTVSQPFLEMATSALELMTKLKKIEQLIDHSGFITKVIPHTIIERDSVSDLTTQKNKGSKSRSTPTSVSPLTNRL